MLPLYVDRSNSEVTALEELNVKLQYFVPLTLNVGCAVSSVGCNVGAVVGCWLVVSKLAST